jgi:hypothetical protein
MQKVLMKVYEKSNQILQELSLKQYLQCKCMDVPLNALQNEAIE